jgi:uncharacterized heparinase superfamily protein
MNKDLFHQIKPIVVSATATISTNTDTNSAAVDTKEFESVVLGLVGHAITDGEYKVKVQHSDDGSTDWQDVDDDGMIFTDTDAKLDATTDNKILKIGYRGDSIRGSRRYVRLVTTSTGVTVGGAFTVIAILGDARIGVLPDDVA